MVTLQNFYKSKEWEKLIALIRMERVHEDGQIYCEQCGRPITDKYDCIGHHKIFLTEDNVNDANIALNPDNIMLVHHKCHSHIHNKLGWTKKEIFLVYGSPLAGKTSYVESVREEGDLIVDIDRIWECVSGCPSHVKPKRLNGIVFGLRDRLMEMVKYKVGKWNNAYIVGGFPLISERERICKELGAREVFIDTPKEECIARLKAAKDRPIDEYEKYIEEWWKRYAPGGTPGTV